MTNILSRSANSRWINGCISIGAGFFILALFVSAVFDPRIRLLHVLQALIYIAVIVLTRRRSAWGYGAGFFIAAFWNYTNLFVSHFIGAGVQQLSILVHTGRLPRPDLLVSVVAGGGHFLLMGACAAEFPRLRSKAWAWGEFLGGGVVAVAYFVAVIYTTGPQYIGLVRRVFHV